MNRSKQIAKKGIKLKAFINIKYCYIWLGIHDLTSEQVLGRATSNFVWKRLVRVKKSLWILGFSATSIKIRHRLFKSWIAPTNCVS